MKELPIIGSVLSDTQSSTSSDDNKFGAAGLYGMKLDNTLNEKIKFDYNKPLLTQLFEANFTFQEYHTYINEPKHLINPVRDIKLFETKWLELCSMSTWW